MQSKFSSILYTVLLALSLAVLSSCSRQPPETTRVIAADSVSDDREIADALALIKKSPDLALAYNQLAIVYIKKARRTGDFELNAKAEEAVRKALEIAPNDAPSRKLQASLHLTFHRFAEGLELGKQLNKEFPNDAFIYGVLTDANAELGNYPEAVAAAQKMVDLKPNSSSYARVAHLRWLHGDHPGSVEMYKLAARTADPQDKEAQSYCLVQLGNELWRSGKYDEAENVFNEALQILPGYHLALAGKGRLTASKGDLEAAAALLTEAKNKVLNPDTIILLGDVHTAQGNAERAREQFDLVEAGEQKLGEMHDAHRMALFWADKDKNLDEALEIARQDYAEVKDIYAADILAWCLYKKGNLSEAKTMITEAMRLKTRDARIYYHAGMIELALNNRIAAKRLIQNALSLNPGFDIIQANHARKAINEMK